MEFNVIKIFEDVAYLSKVHSKKQYESSMDMFKIERMEYLNPFLETEDLEGAAKDFCQQVTEEFKKFGKVRAAELMNLNYFMIYFVFPSLLEKEDGVRICDIIRDVWNQHFKANINYTDYETLKAGFQTRIFGIPIGKN